MYFLFVAGLIAIVAGVALIYWISRRKFNRRNVAGLDGFSSFESSVVVGFLERIGKLAAFILIIIGVLALLTNRWDKQNMNKAELESTLHPKKQVKKE